jgi:hypothetical protein
VTNVEDVRHAVTSVILEINMKLTQLIRFKEENQELAQMLHRLQTHNADVMGTMYLLNHRVPDRTDEIIKMYQLAIHSLEDYRASL